MNLTDYQHAAGATAAPHSDHTLATSNYAMGLAGEAGELVDLLKKDLFHGRKLARSDFISEAGDVLWYLANLCRLYGVDLQRVAEDNLVKLRNRYPNGFVKGGGLRDI